MTSVDDMNAKIAALKLQLAQAEAAKATGDTSVNPAHDDDYEEVEEEYYEEEIVEEYTEYEEVTESEGVGAEVYPLQPVAATAAVTPAAAPAAAPVAPPTPAVAVHEPTPSELNSAAQVHAKEVTNPSAFDYSATRQEQQNALKNPNPWNRPAWGGAEKTQQPSQNYGPTPAHTHLVEKQNHLKKKYQFEKPAWASRNSADDITDVPPVDTNSIQNPLLKQNTTTGYSRQVFAKDKLSRSQGTFVAPREKVPPRLAWIVIDIDQRKVGKIVLHLYGQGTQAIVDSFDQLVGMNIARNGKNKPIQVEELQDPRFFLTINASTKGMETKKDAYGVVQEGKEVIGRIKAADEYAAITIRQAHVYPVKKAKA